MQVHCIILALHSALSSVAAERVLSHARHIHSQRSTVPQPSTVSMGPGPYAKHLAKHKKAQSSDFRQNTDQMRNARAAANFQQGVEAYKERLQALEDQEKHRVSRVNEWFDVNGEAELSTWTTEHVVDFLVDIDQHNLSAKALASNMTGAGLFKLFDEYNEQRASEFGISDHRIWMDIKFDLWNSLVMNKHGNPLPAEDITAQKKCAKKAAFNGFYCDQFELQYVWGLEWSLFKFGEPFSPVPNPIHTFVCSALEWQEYKPLVSFETKEDDSLLMKSLKGIANWIARIAGSMLGALFNILWTGVKCGLCSLCVIWEKIAEKAEQLWKKVKAGGKAIRTLVLQGETQAKRHGAVNRMATLIGSDTDDISQKAKQFWGSAHSDLMQLFSGGNDDQGLRNMWAEKIELQPGNRSLTHEEVLQLVELAENHTATAVSLIEEARAKSFERLGDRVKAEWEPHLNAHRQEGQNHAIASRGSSTSSFLDVSAGTAGLPAVAPVNIKVPAHCLEVMDQQNNLKTFRRAWQIAFNVEEPILGEAATKLLVGDFVGAIKALVPELLLMIIPMKKDYGDCLTVPEEIRQADAQKCTSKHVGMCMASTKYRLLKNVIEQEWPPIDTPNWNTRKRIRGHLKRSLEYISQVSGEERRILDEDMEHRNELSLKVKTWDTDEEDQAKYTLLMWYASIKVWRELALVNASSADLLDVRVGGRHGVPNIEPFIYQFCHTMLRCESSRQEEVFSFARFVQSFNREPDEFTKGEQKPSLWKKVRQVVTSRPKMYKFWHRSLQFKRLLFAKADFEALDNLQDVYETHISALMSEVLDLRTDPYQQPLPFQPHLAFVHSTGVNEDLSELADPSLANSAGFAHTTKEAYVWINVDAVENCPRLHIALVCKEECSSCTIHPEQTGAQSVDKLLNRTGHCLLEKDQARCNACLSERNAQYIVDCNAKPAFPFYSTDHPTQKATVEGRPPTNKYAVLHTFREDLAEKEVLTKPHMLKKDRIKFPFRRQFVNFQDVEGFKKQMLLKELFSTVTNAGKCHCACKAIHDMVDHECVDVISPVDFSQEEPSSAWCLRPTSIVPGAFCCGNRTGSGEIPADISAFALRYGCAKPSRLESAQAVCQRSGLGLCTAAESVQLSRYLQSDGLRNMYNLQQQLLEHMQAGTNEASQSLAPCFLPAKNGGSLANVPFADPSFRVWVKGVDGHVAFRPQRKLDQRQKFFSDGSLLREFDTCVTRSTR